jgi:hypothetical protein
MKTKFLSKQSFYQNKVFIKTKFYENESFSIKKKKTQGFSTKSKSCHKIFSAFSDCYIKTEFFHNF